MPFQYSDHNLKRVGKRTLPEKTSKPMRKRKSLPILKTCLSLFVTLAMMSASGLFAQASNPRVNNEKPEKGNQAKRIHPHALKLILKGKKKEAIAYLKSTTDKKVNPEQTQMLIDLALDKPNAWKFDAKTWPWERTLADTSLKKDAPSDKFTIAFGGGAGYVPPHERMWDTIGAIDPRALLLLGDNVYIDDPKTPEMQLFHYYRRQSQPEWSKLAKKVPIYAIWDDHDFTTNDGWGGPAIEEPTWKRDVWNVFKDNWDNPYYGGGEKQPGCWFDFWIGKVHFVLIDGRYYRESPKGKNPSMLGSAQMKWLKKILKEPATFTVFCTNVPVTPKVKPGSKDTWDGFDGERQKIFQFIAKEKIPGVVILSADRHRSDAYKIDTGIEGNVSALRMPVLKVDQSARSQINQAFLIRLQREAILWAGRLRPHGQGSDVQVHGHKHRR